MGKIISLGGEIMGKINFAMQQNYVPMIRSLILTNETEEDIKDLKLRVSFEPDFVKPFEQNIDVLNPHKPIEISPVKLVMKVDYLASLTEKIVGNIHFEIIQGEECLFEEDHAMELLAYDEWPGVFLMPELLGAFVTPNHPQVRGVLAKAGMLLLKWRGNPSFIGYQSGNPNIVKMQMAAIYGALQEYNIAYHMPPSSYELGQRIRLPHVVLTEKAGTCLDLAVLYASCLEAAGLYPLITIIKGHAFAGAWLEETTFPECVEDDVSALTKRLAIGIEEVCLVECTDYVAGKKMEFDRACKHGADHLLHPQDFLMTIDIQRTRGSGIRPIPLRVFENGEMTMVDYGPRKESEVTGAPKEIDLIGRGTLAVSTKEVTKQQVWERKLLDFSLRNSLLNFRPNKTSIQIMISDLGELEDALSDGDDFTILERPSDFVHTLRDSKIYEIENEKDLVETIAANEFKSKRIRTFLTQTEIEKTRKQLYRQAQLSMEENGTNTLYLALGFLRWFQAGIDTPRYAPIVLIPIEMERKIQKKSYVIHIRDEEIQMNITLLEMLRQNYNINISSLDPLPADEHGVDLPLVFQTVRQAVMNEKSWDVEEFAFIGLFSFSQFIMWNDIHSRTDDLKKNKVVASLMSGKMEWEPVRDCIEAKDLDRKVAPSDMAIPTSADSSQIAAIDAAARGQSFVLHGAPGTGKSQTITNMIANALYQGKSVLFVAEKMAALSVVQTRLERIGLAPFCLEIHSNKAQKKEVLGQLEKTLNYGKVQEPADYARVAGQVHELRSKLNSSVSELHKMRAFGMSVYDAICRYESLEKYKNQIRFSSASCENIGEHTLEQWRDVMKKLLAASVDCGGYKNCEKFYLLADPEIGVDGTERLFEEIERYIIGLKQMDQCIASFTERHGMTKPKSYGEYRNYHKLFCAARPFQYLSEQLLEDSITSVQLNMIHRAVELGKEKGALEAKIASVYEYGILEYPAPAELLEWKRSESLWIFQKNSAQKKLLNNLNLYKKGNPYTKEDFTGALEELVGRTEVSGKINEAVTGIQDLLGGYWNGEHTDWDKVARVCEESAQFRTLLRDVLLPEEDKRKYLHGYCSQLLLQDWENTTDHKEELAYGQLFEIQESVKAGLMENLKFRIDQLDFEGNYIEAVEAVLHQWKLYEADIRPWSNLLKQLMTLNSLGAGEAVEAFCSGAVSSRDFVNAVECNISYALARYGISRSEVLSGFYGPVYEADIEKYADLVKRFEDLTKRELGAKLSANIPNAYSVTEKSPELNILQKAIKNGGRMLSLRKLFDSIPKLLRQMCPCMLMSPMSVAQYIDPQYPKFDLVIFDEASQMPTCEAVGAMARGEHVVVVGDPKQLPPTSFFTGNKVDEENYDKEDLESVLDDCLALTMPEKSLRWHYRSRHESLIAYSNSRYYDNKLYTFPSPDDLVSEVKWVHTDGFYDKGGTRQNQAEAIAVVNEIIRRLGDEEHRKDSIGVVTFSSTQQIAIDDLLVAAFVEHPELELINKESCEPVIIKNLENVQGDERDVILFSIGYGPDESGKVSMNFGPLNNAGGWRRLNVAVTRARKEMVVYSTITPEQIDLKKTRSDGVAGLKGFLEFAARGKNALAVRYDQMKSSDYHVEDHIADALTQLGYEVRRQIGASEFKIDIGIVNPQEPSMYLLGILCDGRNYESANTARDRNIVQPGMLEGLGWKIYRVWTIDWMTNQKSVLERLKTSVEEAEEAYMDSCAVSGAEADRESSAIGGDVAGRDNSAIGGAETVRESCAMNETEPSKENEAEEEQKAGLEHESITTVSFLPVDGRRTQKIATAAQEKSVLPAKAGQDFAAVEVAAAAGSSVVVRTAYAAADIGIVGNIDTFYDKSSAGMIKNCIEKIVEAEGPISRKLLGKRLVSAFGMARTGSKADAQIEDYIKLAKLKSTKTEGIKYFWSRTQDANDYHIYRVPENQDERRSLEDISSPELANAAVGVLMRRADLSLDDLAKEMAKELGFGRVTETLLEDVKRGIKFAEKSGRISKIKKIYNLPEVTEASDIHPM